MSDNTEWYDTLRVNPSYSSKWIGTYCERQVSLTTWPSYFACGRNTVFSYLSHFLRSQTNLLPSTVRNLPEIAQSEGSSCQHTSETDTPILLVLHVYLTRKILPWYSKLVVMGRYRRIGWIFGDRCEWYRRVMHWQPAYDLCDTLFISSRK